MNSSYNYLFKYIIVGDTNVGKSCLLLQYVDRRFRQAHETTIGVEFGAKVLHIHQKMIKVQIWDTVHIKKVFKIKAGQESFRSITRSYYRGSIGALLVYDITKRETFDNLVRWIEEVKQWGQDKLQIVLVGNKLDMAQNRQVSNEEAQALANKYQLRYFETSAKDNTNVDEVFMDVAMRIYSLIENNTIDLRNESCGIKVGLRGSTITEDDKDDINQQKSCC